MMRKAETGRQLAKLLLEFGEIEQQVEALRQILCEQSLFETYTAFRALDRSRSGFVSTLDIMIFLHENGCVVGSQSDVLAYFIRPHDLDEDEHLSYAE